MEAEGFQEPPTAGSDPEWRTNLAVHYLLYRCLWEGRLGKPQTVRRLRKEAFSLMDEAAERRLFSDARASGGLYEVCRDIHRGAELMFSGRHSRA